MGLINAHNNVVWGDSKQLLARVKRELKSFNEVGLIDTNDFYDYVNDVLSDLHMGGYVEKKALLCIENGKAKLPEYFKYLDVAYLCKNNSTHIVKRPQNGYVFYTDTLYEGLKKNGCEFTEERTGFKITVREYINDIEDIRDYNYNYVCPLHVVADVDEQFKYHSTHNNISIKDGYLHTQFEEGEVLIKYYALPIDEETGLPLIPDSEVIQKAIRYCAIYNYFLNWYWNDEVPNGIAQKAAEAKNLYHEAMGQAIHESKLPHFATLVDAIRVQRHRLDTYHQIDQDYYYYNY